MVERRDSLLTSVSISNLAIRRCVLEMTIYAIFNWTKESALLVPQTDKRLANRTPTINALRWCAWLNRYRVSGS